MATIYLRLSLACLAAMLICAYFNKGQAVPYTKPPSRTAKSQPIVRREVPMTSSQIRSVVEVKIGLAVLQRFAKLNTWNLLPEELSGDIHERGLRGFTLLFQYVQLFTALEKMGFNNTELTLYRVLVEQVLTDACNWVTSYNSTIDCSNHAQFLTVLISLGINPYIDQLDCYLEATQNTEVVSLRYQPWVNKTIVGEYEELRCPFCQEINLKRCCA